MSSSAAPDAVLSDIRNKQGGAKQGWKSPISLKSFTRPRLAMVKCRPSNKDAAVTKSQQEDRFNAEMAAAAAAATATAPQVAETVRASKASDSPAEDQSESMDVDDVVIEVGQGSAPSRCEAAEMVDTDPATASMPASAAPDPPLVRASARAKRPRSKAAAKPAVQKNATGKIPRTSTAVDPLYDKPAATTLENGEDVWEFMKALTKEADEALPQEDKKARKQRKCEEEAPLLDRLRKSWNGKTYYEQLEAQLSSATPAPKAAPSSSAQPAITPSVFKYAAEVRHDTEPISMDVEECAAAPAPVADGAAKPRAVANLRSSATAKTTDIELVECIDAAPKGKRNVKDLSKQVEQVASALHESRLRTRRGKAATAPAPPPVTTQTAPTSPAVSKRLQNRAANPLSQSCTQATITSPAVTKKPAAIKASPAAAARSPQPPAQHHAARHADVNVPAGGASSKPSTMAVPLQTQGPTACNDTNPVPDVSASLPSVLAIKRLEAVPPPLQGEAAGEMSPPAASCTPAKWGGRGRTGLSSRLECASTIIRRSRPGAADPNVARIKELQEQLKETEKRLVAEKKLVDSLTRKNETLNSQLQRKDKEISKLKEQRDVAVKEKADLKKKMQEDVTTLEKELKHAKTQHGRLANRASRFNDPPQGGAKMAE